MTDFSIKKPPQPSPLNNPRFAVGEDTGSLYLVPGVSSNMRGICIVGKAGMAAGETAPLNRDEILPPGTIITITT